MSNTPGYPRFTVIVVLGVLVIITIAVVIAMAINDVLS